MELSVKFAIFLCPFHFCCRVDSFRFRFTQLNVTDQHLYIIKHRYSVTLFRIFGMKMLAMAIAVKEKTDKFSNIFSSLCPVSAPKKLDIMLPKTEKRDNQPETGI